MYLSMKFALPKSTIICSRVAARGPGHEVVRRLSEAASVRMVLEDAALAALEYEAGAVENPAEVLGRGVDDGAALADRIPEPAVLVPVELVELHVHDVVAPYIYGYSVAQEPLARHSQRI